MRRRRPPAVPAQLVHEIDEALAAVDTARAHLARARAERDFDIGRSARELLARLGLAAPASDAPDRFARHLDELGCGPGDRIRERVGAAVGELSA